MGAGVPEKEVATAVRRHGGLEGEGFGTKGGGVEVAWLNCRDEWGGRCVSLGKENPTSGLGGQ